MGVDYKATDPAIDWPVAIKRWAARRAPGPKPGGTILQVQKSRDPKIAALQSLTQPSGRAYALGGYCMVAGVHVVPVDGTGVGGWVVLCVGGMVQGTLTKSKKSSRFGCAAARRVRYLVSGHWRNTECRFQAHRGRRQSLSGN
jgi:hypothetical protein